VAKQINKAMKIFLWFQKYWKKNETFPLGMSQTPFTKRDVVEHFGSYQGLKDLVECGIEVRVQRRNKAPRYCRYCHKKLPLNRWFFCPSPDVEDEDHLSCLARYENEIGDGFTEEERKLWEDEELAEAGRKPVAHCRNCINSCEITIPGEQDETKLTFNINCADKEVMHEPSQERIQEREAL
jgi:hypothetical protein